MKNLLKRNSKKRDVWSEEERKAHASLIIPPCDLWHNNENTEAVSHEENNETSPTPQLPENMGSQCWAFMGATGGVGTTSLAIQFAHELSKQTSPFSHVPHKSSQPLVCLIDLDFEAGRVAQYLDVLPGVSLEDLKKEASQIDDAYIQSLFAQHQDSISVLAAPNKIGGNQDINPAVVISLLEIACQMFPYVILDVPQHWQSWSMAAIGGSDSVWLVSDLTIPSLNAAREKRAQIAQIFKNEKSCDYILNKYERRYLKSSIRLPDAKKALKSDIFGTVCLEPEVAIDAINCGIPIGVAHSSSRIAKDCERLLAKVLEAKKSSALEVKSA